MYSTRRRVNLFIDCAPGKNYAGARLVKERIYFGSTSGLVYEIDPKLGHLVTGQVQIPDRITDPIVYSAAHNLFYVRSYDGRIFAFQRSDTHDRP